jgi:hypothetical protein
MGEQSVLFDGYLLKRQNNETGQESRGDRPDDSPYGGRQRNVKGDEV